MKAMLKDSLEEGDGNVKEDGGYAGFDADEFTSRSGGKLNAIYHIKVCCRALEACTQTSSLPYCIGSLLTEMSNCDCVRTSLTGGGEGQDKYGYKPLVMVGDGATDLEARQSGGADIFIGCVCDPCLLHEHPRLSRLPPSSLRVVIACHSCQLTARGKTLATVLRGKALQ